MLVRKGTHTPTRLVNHSVLCARVYVWVRVCVVVCVGACVQVKQKTEANFRVASDLKTIHIN
jgi:hypothetical protein